MMTTASDGADAKEVYYKLRQTANMTREAISIKEVNFSAVILLFEDKC
jgi:hypothetical protein